MSVAIVPDISKLRGQVEQILRLPVSEKERREKLEPVAVHEHFARLTDLWGPELYKRDRILWRPFILQHFSPWSFLDVIAWKGAAGTRLDAWLAAVDADGDVELFRRLYGWKLDSLHRGKEGEQVWRRDLLKHFASAATRAERNQVLAKFDTWRSLDQPAAVRLYEIDSVTAAPFILRHLPIAWSWSGESRAMWDELGAAARKKGDDDFYFSLYRRRASIASWEKDVLRCAEELRDEAKLLAELQRRHPEGWGLKLGGVYYELVKRRGRDVFPYVIPRLKDAFSGWGTQAGYKPLLAIAKQNQWHDLWAALIRTAADPKTYDDEVEKLVDDTTRPVNEVQRLLVMLTGVSREWNFGPFSFARVLPLEGATAVKLYRRFPHLLRGPFKMNIGVRHGTDYDELTRIAIEGGDEEIVDYLGSRAAMLTIWGNPPKSIERLADYYLALAQNPDEFAVRAAAALTHIPAFSIWNYDQLLRENRLARILFERTEELMLRSERSVRDLLECPQIYVQALAFRALSTDSDRARELAAANVDLLQAALLRPLHRRTRLTAFKALRNAASRPDTASYLVARIRETFHLPGKRYPREQLIGLLGEILHRWPELRGERERPVVYGAASA